jgi:hypothetical protein
MHWTIHASPDLLDSFSCDDYARPCGPSWRYADGYAIQRVLQASLPLVGFALHVLYSPLHVLCSRAQVAPFAERSHQDLAPARTRRVASHKPRNLLLELIDPFIERSKREFPNMLAGRSVLLGFDVELFQFLEF